MQRCESEMAKRGKERGGERESNRSIPHRGLLTGEVGETVRNDKIIPL